MEQFKYKRPNNIRREMIKIDIAECKKIRDRLWKVVDKTQDDFSKQQLRETNRAIDNLENELKTIPLEPEAGMGATIGWNGDAYPYTIHKIAINLTTKKITSVWASQDEFKYTGKPISWGQEYDESKMLFRNEHKTEVEWTEYKLRKNGRYVRAGAKMNDPWATLQLGHRSYRQNPSF
jgi:hypothetical protein